VECPGHKPATNDDSGLPRGAVPTSLGMRRHHPRPHGHVDGSLASRLDDASGWPRAQAPGHRSPPRPPDLPRPFQYRGNSPVVGRRPGRGGDRRIPPSYRRPKRNRTDGQHADRAGGGSDRGGGLALGDPVRPPQLHLEPHPTGDGGTGDGGVVHQVAVDDHAGHRRRGILRWRPPARPACGKCAPRHPRGALAPGTTRARLPDSAGSGLRHGPRNRDRHPDLPRLRRPRKRSAALAHPTVHRRDRSDRPGIATPAHGWPHSA
jgi:hypothetical protein